MERDASRDSARHPDARVSPAMRAFIAGLRRKAANAPDDAGDWESSQIRQVSRADDLPARFAVAAEKAGAAVQRASIETAAQTVRSVVEARVAQRIHVPPCDDGVLAGTLRKRVLAALSQMPVLVSCDNADAALFVADASVTGASAAIAETGTMVCTTAGGQTRGSTLYAPVHIVLLGRSQIMPDLCDYFDEACTRGELPSNVNLITGPSKTADIEGVLVVGVHGPGALHIVIVDDL